MIYFFLFFEQARRVGYSYIYTLVTFLKVLNTSKIPLQDLTDISRLFCLIWFKFNYSYTMNISTAKKNKDH